MFPAFSVLIQQTFLKIKRLFNQLVSFCFSLMQWSHQNTSGTAQKIWIGWRGLGGFEGKRATGPGCIIAAMPNWFSFSYHSNASWDGWFVSRFGIDHSNLWMTLVIIHFQQHPFEQCEKSHFYRWEHMNLFQQKIYIFPVAFPMSPKNLSNVSISGAIN